MKKTLVLCLFAVLVAAASAQQGEAPRGIPHLDHVFVIMMENHGYSQIVGNPHAPFANQYAKSANAATNYFAVGHPSSTNYLEVVGGSNFGVRSDNSPDWHNATCSPNIVAPSYTTTDYPASNNVCPIAGEGMDAATPPIDTTNECPDPSTTDPCPPGLIDIDGTGLAAAHTVGKMIGDQLAEKGLRWKSYQESLPAAGPDNIGYSDGYFTDLSTIPDSLGGSGAFVKLYAAKHNPFVFFKSVQEGTDPNNSLKNVAGFEGKNGLYADLGSGHLPSLSFIVPNQCNDQHGRGNGGAECAFDPVTDGSQAGLNPALIYVGDLTLRTIVTAIHDSPVWKEGNNAIVTLWDENDYSFVPNLNQVLVIVDTNYGPHGLKSDRHYTHFSLTRSLEAAFGLPCLNHACDKSTKVMSDLFGGRDE
ncbi:MAG TPA: alkaline phosphatase family protein [Candidatus Sulfotelmatobacter sp.]|nr:alkaline phosphatase family protein [Candidatus Sulfotelmatobacter sp.]